MENQDLDKVDRLASPTIQIFSKIVKIVISQICLSSSLFTPPFVSRRCAQNLYLHSSFFRSAIQSPNSACATGCVAYGGVSGAFLLVGVSGISRA